MKQLAELLSRFKWVDYDISIPLQRKTAVWRMQEIGSFKLLVTCELVGSSGTIWLKHWYFQQWQNELIYSHGDLKKDFLELYKRSFNATNGVKK